MKKNKINFIEEGKECFQISNSVTPFILSENDMKVMYGGDELEERVCLGVFSIQGCFGIFACGHNHAHK